MNDATPDTGRSWLGTKTTSAANGVVAKAKAVARILRKREQVFELPGRLFDVLPVAVYVCAQDGLVLRYNRRAAELWGRSPKLGDPGERFCGSYGMFRPDGSPVPHDQCPMAEVLRTGISVHDQEVHIERPDGARGIALVNIEAVKDDDGNIVGAVNCFHDITERKQSEEYAKILSRELDHRAKNLLTLVQATVHLTQARTANDFKKAIAGRLQALSNAHTLLAQSRWTGAELRTLVTEELSPYCPDGASRAVINGPEIVLTAKSAQSIAIVLHELTTNAVKYGALSVPKGRVRVEWSIAETHLVIRWSETKGPRVTPPSREGFGTRVVAKIIDAELEGKMRLDWHRGGLRCEIAIPVAQPAVTAVRSDGDAAGTKIDTRSWGSPRA
jgi:two-component sensor histidine kinase